MIKIIIQTLIIAFLLYLIPLIFNSLTHGGLIRFLGGITPQDIIVLSSQDGSSREITMAKETEHIYAERAQAENPLHQWQIKKVR